MFKTPLLCLALCAALEAQRQRISIYPRGKSLNSAGISVPEFNAAVSDAQMILKASGVSSADAATIATDLKAIGAEVQKTAQTGDLRIEFGRK